MQSKVLPFGALVILSLVSFSVGKGLSESDEPEGQSSGSESSLPFIPGDLGSGTKTSQNLESRVSLLLADLKPTSSGIGLGNELSDDDLEQLIAREETGGVASRFDVLPISDPHLDYEQRALDFTTIEDEQVFLSQAIDSDWAFETESAMWDSFNQADLERSQMTQLECRETLCRAEVFHDSEDAQNVFYDAVINKTDQYQGNLIQYKDESGRLVTTLYRYR